MTWTRPADAREQVQKLWARGALLTAMANGDALFPLRLSLKGPDAKELSTRFDEVRSWIDELGRMRWCRVEMRETQNRVLGRNHVPCGLVVETLDDALAWLGRKKDADDFLRMVNEAATREPMVAPWLARRPHRALELRDDWSRLLDVVGWMKAHPRPRVYLREVDLPDIHTKYLEAHRGVLAELFDLVLPAEVVDVTATGIVGFARRYGFLSRPERWRLRLLDPALAVVRTVAPSGLQDLTVDLATLARLDLSAERVFMTENEMNFLAFPEAPRSVVLFGAGYGFTDLETVDWLRRSRVLYWGDLDTHGFAILNQLRQVCPHAESFLMDRDTLLACEPQWGTESHPTRADLPLLTEAEAAVYDDLRHHRLRPNLRLEQERIGFGRVEAALRLRGWL